MYLLILLISYATDRALHDSPGNTVVYIFFLPYISVYAWLFKHEHMDVSLHENVQKLSRLL